MFYGGAAGGGKSDALLMGALQYVDVPGYAALLLRRNYKQLSMPGALMDRAHTWLDPTDARWHEGRKTWTFPSGATITFGYLGLNRDDRRQYESAEFQYIGLDELTAFGELDYRFMFSRCRRTMGQPVPLRVRSASNPGGDGHAWVKSRFVDPNTRIGRAMFIKAFLWDNPHVDQAEYIAMLQELHPVLWQRLLHGDWEAADVGELFQPRVWLEQDDFLDAPPDLGVKARVRYWDLAASEPNANNPDPDWTAGARISRIVDPDSSRPLYVCEHVVRVRKTPAATERTFAATASADPRRCVQWIEQTAGAGKALVDHYKRNVTPDDVVCRGNAVKGSKAVRARPLAAVMEKHRMKFVKGPWLDALFDEMEAFSEDPQRSGAHDDQIDACAGAYEKVKGGAAVGTSQQAAGGQVQR